MLIKVSSVTHIDFTRKNYGSFLYHTFNLNVNNSFAPLTSIPGHDSIFLSSVSSPTSSFHMQGHSSLATSEADSSKPHNHVSSSSSTHPFNMPDTTLGKVPNNIRTAVLNANSVRGKKDEIADFCNRIKVYIVVITETKVDNTISSSEFLSCNYDGHSCRDQSASGGGVLIPVSNNLVVDEVSLESLNSEKFAQDSVYWRLTLCMNLHTTNPIMTSQSAAWKQHPITFKTSPRTTPNLVLSLPGTSMPRTFNWTY